MQSNETTVLISYRKSVESDDTYLKRVSAHLAQALAEDSAQGIYGRTVLVAQGYWIEYISGSAPPTKEQTSADVLLSLKKAGTADTEVAPGGGVNLRLPCESLLTQ